MKIYDIAKRLIHLSGRSISENSDSEGIEIVEIGLRDGEKMFEELLISGDEIPTENPKIFKSNEKFLTLAELNNKMDEATKCIYQHDIKGIIKILEDNVDGFTG